MHKRNLRHLVRNVGGIVLTIGCVAAGLYYAPWAPAHMNVVGKVMVVSFVVAIICGAFWMLSDSDSSALSEKEFDKKMEQALTEFKKEVSSVVDAKIHAPATPLLSEEAIEQEVATHPVDQLLTPLQQEALTLSTKLLGFIEAQGPPPAPKYTKKQIDEMPSAQHKALVMANDKDFDFACEYHYGGNISEGGPQTADELHKLMMARFMLLHPWYEKVRASYELEFRVEVERMRNRFAVEGLADDILRVPVEGKMERENIRAIASKLWNSRTKYARKESRLKTPEYHEGPEALERFGKTMTALFRAPKTVTAKKETKKPTRKRSKASKG